MEIVFDKIIECPVNGFVAEFKDKSHNTTFKFDILSLHSRIETFNKLELNTTHEKKAFKKLKTKLSSCINEDAIKRKYANFIYRQVLQTNYV